MVSYRIALQWITTAFVSDSTLRHSQVVSILALFKGTQGYVNLGWGINSHDVDLAEIFPAKRLIISIGLIQLLLNNERSELSLGYNKCCVVKHPRKQVAKSVYIDLLACAVGKGAQQGISGNGDTHGQTENGMDVGFLVSEW